MQKAFGVRARRGAERRLQMSKGREESRNHDDEDRRLISRERKYRRDILESGLSAIVLAMFGRAIDPTRHFH